MEEEDTPIWRSCDRRRARISSACVCSIRAAGMSLLACFACLHEERESKALTTMRDGRTEGGRGENVCFQNKTLSRGVIEREVREEVSLHGIEKVKEGSVTGLGLGQTIKFSSRKSRFI